MGELWRKRKWRRLLSLIRQLPPTSLYGEALWADQDLAQEVSGDEFDHSGPRFSQWSPELNVLAEISDRMAVVINTLRVTIQNEPLDLPPHPRPRSAIQDAVIARKRQLHESLVRRLTPK